MIFGLDLRITYTRVSGAGLKQGTSLQQIIGAQIVLLRMRNTTVENSITTALT